MADDSPLRQAQGTLRVRTGGQGLVEITDEVGRWVREQGLGTGLLVLFCRHTSASLTIQENADPSVQRDLEAFLKRLVPEDPRQYSHTQEGADDMPAHIRSALTDVALSIPVADGRPVLGTWQGIYLFEHRSRGHERQVVAHLTGV